MNWELFDQKLCERGFRPCFLNDKPVGWSHNYWSDISRERVCRYIVDGNFDGLTRYLHDAWPRFSATDMLALVTV